jgi:hypothetical protein
LPRSQSSFGSKAILQGGSLFRGRPKALQAEKRAIEAAEKADKAHKKIAILQATMNAHQVTQAERLVSREVLREVEERLSGSIDNLGARFERLGEKLDSFVKELISHRKGSE